MDEKNLALINKKLDSIDERITLIEKEIRLIREDILSGNPKERMRRRMLENVDENFFEKKKKLEKDIKIKI
jgi:Mg2+ and Co2+ transporter CorA